MDGEINELRQRLRQYSDAKVLSSEIVDGRIEVTCQLVPDDREVVALITSGFGGHKGGLYRVPSAGETVVVAMVDGDPTRARVIGFAPTSNDAIPDDIEDGSTYMVAPDDEKLVIRATADVEITSKGASINVTSEGGGDVNLASESGKVNAGSLSASIALALAPAVKAKLSSMVGTYNGHLHIFPIPLVPIAPGPTSPPTQPMAPVGDIATKNLKGD